MRRVAAGYCGGVLRRGARRLFSYSRGRSASISILRISKLLLPLAAESAKVGPVSLFALRGPLDQFEVDLGGASNAGALRVIPRDTPLPVSV
jgi:hypothetical protein